MLSDFHISEFHILIIKMGIVSFLYTVHQPSKRRIHNTPDTISCLCNVHMCTCAFWHHSHLSFIFWSYCTLCYLLPVYGDLSLSDSWLTSSTTKYIAMDIILVCAFCCALFWDWFFAVIGYPSPSCLDCWPSQVFVSHTSDCRYDIVAGYFIMPNHHPCNPARLFGAWSFARWPLWHCCMAQWKASQRNPGGATTWSIFKV